MWGLGRLNAALMPVIGSVWRFVNAVVRGWRFRPRADIPLPSPTTAGRIMSVPPSSTSTRGRSVVTFTVNGQRVTVFDRVRPRPRLADVPQTVWMVHLPEPQPFHDYPDGSWVDGPARWYVRTSRFRMGASPRVIAAIAARLTAARVAPAGTLD